MRFKETIEFVFCLYESSYSPAFIRSWSCLCSYLNKKKIKYVTTQGDSCNAFYSRQMCLGGNVLSGPYQKPFQEKLKYKYLVFLGGSLSFSIENFIELHNIIDCHSFDFLAVDIDGRNELQEPFNNGLARANYTELDMAIIRKGVFEKMEYPWFRPHKPKNSKEQQLVDVGICNRLRAENDIELWVTDDIIVKRV